VHTYKLDARDGIEHIIQIVHEEEDVYDVETVHSFAGHEIRTSRAYNKCIFEELLSLGIITPVNS
jgi:hypothetical protein